MSSFALAPALAAGAATAVAAGLMPRWVATLPEPEEPEEGKPPYAVLATGATPYYVGAGAIVGAVLGGTLGWVWPLLFLVPLGALGVALAHLDFRTRLLPKRLVLPAYPVLVVLLLVVGLLDGSIDGLTRAAGGWLAASLLYWCLWRFTRGMGYGDVRMSGLLGLALGYLGWSTLVLGLYAGFVVGVLGWVVLRLARLTRDRHFPFGPFMLVGAVVGIALVAAGWSPLAP